MENRETKILSPNEDTQSTKRISLKSENSTVLSRSRSIGRSSLGESSYTDSFDEGDKSQESWVGDPQLGTPEVTKLRNKRKDARKRYWDSVLLVVQEAERLQLQKGFHKGKEAAAGDPYNTSETPTNFHAWLIKVKRALPSNTGELGRCEELLQGKYYRILRHAGNLIFAKCAFTDEDQDYEDDDEQHLKEAGSIDQAEYRKNFNYFDHLETIRAFPTTLAKKRKMFRYLNSEAELFNQMKEVNSTVRVRSCLHNVKVFVRLGLNLANLCMLSFNSK